jgi:hypothetical protein
MNDVIHPTNRVFPSGHVMDTVEAAYDEGFTTGLTWPDKWEPSVPGGPHVFTDDPFGGCSALAKHSRAVNEAWRHGWRVGHTKKVALGGSVALPSW